MVRLVKKNILQEIVPDLLRLKAPSFIIALIILSICGLSFTSLYVLGDIPIFESFYYTVIISAIVIVIGLFVYKYKWQLSENIYLLYIWQSVLQVYLLYFIIGIPFQIIVAKTISTELLVGCLALLFQGLGSLLQVLILTAGLTYLFFNRVVVKHVVLLFMGIVLVGILVDMFIFEPTYSVSWILKIVLDSLEGVLFFYGFCMTRGFRWIPTNPLFYFIFVGVALGVLALITNLLLLFALGNMTLNAALRSGYMNVFSFMLFGLYSLIYIKIIEHQK